MSDTLNNGNYDEKSKFCNSCGSQCFHISYRSQDYQCSNKDCRRLFKRVESKNLLHKSDLAPATGNRLLSAGIQTNEAMDEYDELEKQKVREDFSRQVDVMAPSTINFSTNTSGSHRKLDTDDKMLIDQGYTVIDLQ